MVGLKIIFIIGLTNMFNFLLADRTMMKLFQRPAEQLYKKVLLVYLVLMGFLIMNLHTLLDFPYFYCSTLALVVHLIYMIILFRIKPYQLSLNVHSYGLNINQLVVLIVLAFVNLLNYIENLNEILVLALGYFIIGVCCGIIVLSGVRLFYEYKYG